MDSDFGVERTPEVLNVSPKIRTNYFGFEWFNLTLEKVRFEEKPSEWIKRKFARKKNKLVVNVIEVLEKNKYFNLTKIGLM